MIREYVSGYQVGYCIFYWQEIVRRVREARCSRGVLFSERLSNNTERRASVIAVLYRL